MTPLALQGTSFKKHGCTYPIAIMNRKLLYVCYILHHIHSPRCFHTRTINYRLNYSLTIDFNIYVNTEFNDKISIVFIAPLSFNKESFNEYFLSRVKIIEINDYIDKIEVGKQE